MNQQYALKCPACHKLLGHHLNGIYETKCPRCKTYIRFTRRLYDGVDTAVQLDRAVMAV